MCFDEKGAGNTEQCVELALKTAAERNIRHIVVASGSGDTARLFIGAKGARVVCVTNAYGFKEPGKTKITDAARQELERAGIRVLAATLCSAARSGGISRSMAAWARWSCGPTPCACSARASRSAWRSRSWPWTRA